MRGGHLAGESVDVAASLLDAAADLGDEMLRRRRPPGVLLVLLWLLALVDAALLYFRFPMLFDRAPGLAVLVGGVFAMLLMGLIAITAAPLRGHLIRSPY